MKKVFAVFGATGNQGGSVARYVLQTPKLSETYKLRLVVRNANKPELREFTAKGAEVVEADLDDESRLHAAFRGAWGVFALTSWFFHFSKEKEIEQSKRIADIAVAEGVEYLIYSSLPSASKISDGKYDHVLHFEGKAEAEKYIRGLPIKSAFYMPSFYMQNLLTDMIPRPVGEGTFATMATFNPDTRIPMVDIDDSGKYVGAILADPEAFNGKQVHAAGSLATFQEVAASISKATDKKVVYRQLPEDVYKSHLPESVGEELVQMFGLFRDYGLFGSDQESKVKAGAELALEKPSSMEEFVAKNADALAKKMSG